MHGNIKGDKMFRYAMKAAAHSEAQLADRIDKFKKIKMSPVLELFFPGFEDLVRNPERLIRNCLNFKGCKYMVHFPIIDIKSGYFFDAYNDETVLIKMLLDFCRVINSDTLVIHRCCGFSVDIGKDEAEKVFFEKATLWNDMAGKKRVRILIENYGFVWMPEAMGIEYLSSPLDHFFPWDMIRFNEARRKAGLENIGILLDMAHAVISSNMFNMLKTHPSLRPDPRFGNIYGDDLDKTDLLKVDDFIHSFISYFHISDSFIWQAKDGTDDMERYLVTESLAIGKGNIDYAAIFKGLNGDKLLVMEIDPEDGDYTDNAAQLEGIEYFKAIFNRRDCVCA